MLIYKHIVSILEPVIRILLSISEPQVKNILAYKKKKMYITSHNRKPIPGQALLTTGILLYTQANYCGNVPAHGRKLQVITPVVPAGGEYTQNLLTHYRLPDLKISMRGRVKPVQALMERIKSFIILFFEKITFRFHKDFLIRSTGAIAQYGSQVRQFL